MVSLVVWLPPSLTATKLAQDFTIRMWDANGKFVQLFSGHGGPVRCLCGKDLFTHFPFKRPSHRPTCVPQL